MKKGQGLIEYVLILILIAIIIFAAVAIVGPCFQHAVYVCR